MEELPVLLEPEINLWIRPLVIATLELERRVLGPRASSPALFPLYATLLVWQAGTFALPALGAPVIVEGSD